MRVLSIGWALLWLTVAACQPEIDISPPKRKPSEQPALTAEQLAALPPSKRMLGTWTIDLTKVPEGALNDELRELRKRGLADKVQLQYIFREGEFIMRKEGAGGPVERRYEYEIIEERPDRLELRRRDSEGKPQRVFVRFEGDKMKLGMGDSAVRLTRK